MSDQNLKYGRIWPAGTTDLDIEFSMIRNAPVDQKLQHYLAAHKLLWPEDEQHRWFVLGMKTIVENRVSVFLGCASSGKTYTMSCHALIDFFVHPRNSLSLISSTEKRSLEIKVWGRVKELFNRARLNHPDLDGFVLESSMAIVPDDVDSDNEFARELNRGIVCFPTGTMVDVPNGKRRIETIKTGDKVINSFGVGIVKNTCSNKCKQLVRVHIDDGRKIDCTPEHPFMTGRGWIKAVDLTSFDVVLSVHETMQIMRIGISAKVRESKVLQPCMQNESSGIKHMRKLWKKFQTFKNESIKTRCPFLLRSLCRIVGVEKCEDAKFKNVELQKMRKENVRGSQKPNILLHLLQKRLNSYAMSSMWKKVHINSRYIYKAKDSVLFKILQEESDWFSQRKTPCESDGRGANSLGYVSRLNSTLSFKNWIKNQGWEIPLVSTRLGFSGNQTGSGNRWRCTSKAGSCDGGQKENGSSKLSRVVSVEILEQTGDSRFRKSDGGYTVHNLEVEGHPSYSVNGVIVHNCVPCVSGGRFIGMGKFQGAKPPHTPGKNDGILKHYGDEAAVMQPSFLDAYTNWTVSPGFKGVMSGNPTDISDPLCTAAEPVGGWDVFVDSGKTQEWTSQWYSARAVAFDGRDTPNNDDPKKFYPFLVSAEWIESLKRTHGEDSWQLFQQGIGKPSRGMVSNRVITIGMCERGKAFDFAIFKDTNFTDIYALDPAYGGGDRCVGGMIRIGTLLDGTQVIEVGEPEVIPIRLTSNQEPEDQIAEYVFNKMKSLNIPAQNGFYDSFGRGTLGFSFAKVFGSLCPVPVDSGAKPTSRPVRFDLFIEDKSGKRLKRCDEEYSKFVTEMWFSTREAIESQQIRTLPREVAYEGQLRLFEVVSGNRVEVETKADMKARVKKSPDLYDWFAIAVEGARQRGFKINRIGNAVESKRPPDWLDKRLVELKELRKSKELRH